MTAAPTLAAVLADVTARALDEHPGGWVPLTGPLRALDGLASSPVDGDMRAWATRIAAPGGPVPLPGTGLRAAPYPGLLWAGERCTRAGLGAPVHLTLVGLVVGAEQACSAADVGRAVHAGLAVAQVLDERIAAVAQPVALPTAGAVPAAVCAALLAGVPPADLPDVLDLVGSLMAVSVPGAPAAPWSGHSWAAGWLAVRASTSGLVGMPDGLDHTVAAVTGPGVGEDLLARPAGEVAAAALLERLR